jgi:hypothetical protein
MKQNCAFMAQNWIITFIQKYLKLLLLLIIILLLLLLLLTVIELTPGASSTVQFTHKLYSEYRERNIHNNKKEKKNWEVRAVPRLYELYAGICPTTEEKHGETSVAKKTAVARENFSMYSVYESS